MNDLGGKGMMDTHRLKAVLFLVIAAVLWSAGGVLIKLVDLHPVAIAGARSAIASVFLLPMVRRRHFTWSGAQIGAALAYSATVLTFVAATKMTTAANAILLQYTAPVYVAVLGIRLLGERVRVTDWATIVVTLGGILLFFLDELSVGGYWGNLLAIASGVSFACMIVLLRKQRHSSSLESIFIGNVLTALIGVPLLVGNLPDATGWLGLVLLGTFQLGLSYVLYTYATRHVSALDAVIIPALEPILNPVWVFLIVGEQPGLWAMVGGGIVLIAATTRCVLSIRRKSYSTT